MTGHSLYARSLDSTALVGARYIVPLVPPSQLNSARLSSPIFETGRSVQFVLRDFLNYRLLAVNYKLSPINSAPRTTHSPLSTTHSLLNSPCGEEKPAPAAPANTAARLPAPLENILSRGRTSPCRDTHGPDCNAENDAAHSGALQWLVRATESLHRNVQVQSGTLRCRCTDCRTPDPLRSRACTPRWRLRSGPENDTSSRETCRPLRSGAVRARIGTARRPARNHLPSGLDTRLGGFPRLWSRFPGSWCKLLTHGFGGVKSTRVPSVRWGNLYFVPGADSGNSGDKKRRWSCTQQAKTKGET